MAAGAQPPPGNQGSIMCNRYSGSQIPTSGRSGRWVTVYGFNQASASYILHQFAQYGKILKHVMSNIGNWMHICYQTKLQARKALSKDGRIYGDCIRIGVRPCTDTSVMENLERSSASSMSSVFSPHTKPLASTPVFLERQTPST
ncbi:PREDICTED: nucleoporin NUP53-like, partial [Calidris pugnax]|uniref:nucleoporin NUP53-like n=1 Tax=Calidris pugnax TaxID=198806 RepID=UPI00071C48F1